MSVYDDRPHVLVGVDGSASAERSARWAADDAARRSLPLLIASVCDVPGFLGKPYDGRVEPSRVEANSYRALAVAADSVAQHYPAVTTRTAMITGPATDELTELSRSAVLTVVGVDGSGGATALGSVATHLLDHGCSPIAVVRGNVDGPAHVGGAVVVGVDGSERDDASIELAFDEACRRDKRLVAVHVWHAAGHHPATGTDREWYADEAHRGETLAERLAGWQEKYPDVRVRRATYSSDPSAALLAQSVRAQLIVVGTHGDRNGVGAPVDSVSKELLHHSGCPVLVTRPGPSHPR